MFGRKKRGEIAARWLFTVRIGVSAAGRAPGGWEEGGAKALRHASSSLLREISGSMVSLTELLSTDLTKTDEVWPISFPYPT